MDDLNFIWANFAFEKLENLAVNKSDGLFLDHNEVLSELGTNIGLLSTYIVRRSVALTGLDYAYRHVHGFSFASTAIVFWVISEPGKSYFMKGPFVLCMPTTPEEIKEFNKNGIVNEGFEVYGIYFFETLSGLKHRFNRQVVKSILSKNFGCLWRGMLVGWIGGWDSPCGRRLKMFQMYWKYPECWIAVPLFVLPRFVNAYMYKIYKIFFSHRKLKIFVNN